MTTTANKVGRPTKYDPAFIEETLTLMGKGWSKTRVAAKLGVHKATFYDWMEAHPEFLDAVRLGETLSEAWWEAEGQNALWVHKYNTGMFKWLTGNMHGWSEKQSQDVKVEDLTPGARIEHARRRAFGEPE